MRFPTKFYADLFGVDDYYLPPPPEGPKGQISEVADVNRVLRMIRRTKEIVTSGERRYSFQTLPLQYKLLLLEFVENQVIGSDKYYSYFNSIDERKADLNKDKKELRQALVQFNADKDQRKQAYQKRYAAKKAEIQAQTEKIESYKTGRNQRFLQSAQAKLKILQKQLDDFDFQKEEQELFNEFKQKQQYTDIKLQQLQQMQQSAILGVDQLGNQYQACNYSENQYLTITTLDGKAYPVKSNECIEQIAENCRNHALMLELYQLTLFDPESSALEKLMYRRSETSEEDLRNGSSLNSTDINQYYQSLLENNKVTEFAQKVVGFQLLRKDKRLAIGEVNFQKLVQELWQ